MHRDEIIWLPFVLAYFSVNAVQVSQNYRVASNSVQLSIKFLPHLKVNADIVDIWIDHEIYKIQEW